MCHCYFACQSSRAHTTGGKTSQIRGSCFGVHSEVTSSKTIWIYDAVLNLGVNQVTALKESIWHKSYKDSNLLTSFVQQKSPAYSVQSLEGRCGVRFNCSIPPIYRRLKAYPLTKERFILCYRLCQWEVGIMQLGPNSRTSPNWILATKFFNVLISGYQISSWESRGPRRKEQSLDNWKTGSKPAGETVLELRDPHLGHWLFQETGKRSNACEVKEVHSSLEGLPLALLGFF